MRFNKNEISLIEKSFYWSLPSFVTPFEKDIEIQAQLEEKLNKAVKRRLISDVTPCIALSSGIDSSLIAYYSAINSDAKLNTFVSLFPASRPKYVLLVMLDEPKPAPNYIYNFPPSEKFPNGYKYKGEKRNTSGWNTVVVAGKIIEKIGPILAIKNLQASKNF